MALDELMEFHVGVQLAALDIDDATLHRFVVGRFVESLACRTRREPYVLADLARDYALGVVSNFYGNVERILARRGVRAAARVVADSTGSELRNPTGASSTFAVAALGNALPTPRCTSATPTNATCSPRTPRGCAPPGWSRTRHSGQPTATRSPIWSSIRSSELADASIPARPLPRRGKVGWRANGDHRLSPILSSLPGGRDAEGAAMKAGTHRRRPRRAPARGGHHDAEAARRGRRNAAHRPRARRRRGGGHRGRRLHLQRGGRRRRDALPQPPGRAAAAHRPPHDAELDGEPVRARAASRRRAPFLLLTVDAVFAPRRAARLPRRRSAAADADVVLAVTDFVDDEKPLRRRARRDGRVTALGDDAAASALVTAGFYVLRPAHLRRDRGGARGALHRAAPVSCAISSRAAIASTACASARRSTSTARRTSPPPRRSCAAASHRELDFLGIARERVYSPGKVDARPRHPRRRRRTARAPAYGCACVERRRAAAPRVARGRTSSSPCARAPPRSPRLRRWEAAGVRVINSPAAIVNCQRAPHARRLRARTASPTRRASCCAPTRRRRCPTWVDAGAWLKRGDVHATEPDDVVLRRRPRRRARARSPPCAAAASPPRSCSATSRAT